MSNRLENFVRDHREEFDGEEPDSKIWEAIRKDMGLGEDPNKKKPAPVVRLYRVRYGVAAAVVLLIAGTVWFYSSRQSHTPGQPTGNPAVASGTTHPAPRTTQPTTQPVNPSEQTPALNPDSGQSLAKSTPDEKAEISAEQNEEMYHYAKLVEIKQKELKTIEKDEPLLYKQFSMDVNKLDSAYHSLQSQLSKNPNQEQILEAMLQNLQLQMGLLNHQLDIIKQINHSKQSAYEKAYKTT
ncbi:MAG TPA: hypothetical protein VL978_10810 [Puia sp.]|nr:hypothetical protein [Puia sp.]